MKRSLMISLIVALIFVLLTATAIFAGFYRNVDKDTTCPPGGTCSDNFGVYVQSSGGPGGGCVDAWIGYIGWDLTSETRTWQSASLKLTQYNVAGGEPPFTLKLYPANNDTWTETGADPGYDNTNELASVQYNGTDATVEFASDALGDYFLNKKGGSASVAVVMTDGCGPVSGTVQFEDMEGSSGNAPTSANEADLTFWTGPVVSGTPTAVEMSSFSADNTQPVNYALYAGLAALAVLALGAVGYGYSRTR